MSRVTPEYIFIDHSGIGQGVGEAMLAPSALVLCLLLSQAVGHVYFSPLDFLHYERATTQLGEKGGARSCLVPQCGRVASRRETRGIITYARET